jgi:hypothetical protein
MVKMFGDVVADDDVVIDVVVVADDNSEKLQLTRKNELNI